METLVGYVMLALWEMQFQAADFGNEPVTQANSHDVSDSAELFLAIFLSLIRFEDAFVKHPVTLCLLGSFSQLIKRRSHGAPPLAPFHQ